jgi:hypothetical protein
MAIFYKTQSLTSAVVPALHHALITNSANLAKPAHEVALEMAKDVQAKATGTLAVGRVLAAFGLLAVIFLAGIWTEPHTNLQRWTNALYDAFKVGLPGLIGLIIGEGAGKSG